MSALKRPFSVYKVWTWTRDFDVKDTKVVILGQDPYHGPGQAHGLCFSVQKGTRIPPSLVNMYKELTEDENVNFTHPGHGFLQGITGFFCPLFRIQVGAANTKIYVLLFQDGPTRVCYCSTHV